MHNIKCRNKYQKIFNFEQFGPVNNETILITIQVHDRLSYLLHLIESLKAAASISKILLIISHDVYNETINEVLHSEIDFCMFTQIFYPFSIQTHPLIFPGDDPKDCPRDVTKKEAFDLNCNNKNHPDMYGHYREAKFTQMKHHWWWKLNEIFDRMSFTKTFDGFLLLLEEDYYMAPDFLQVMSSMKRAVINDTNYKSCNIISLGTYTETINRQSFDALDVYPWITGQHNMGFAFNKSTWNDIKRCAKYFCDYDEYNYDYSLQNANYECLEKKLFAVMIRGPRVFHTGGCSGVHHQDKHCEAEDIISRIKAKLKIAEKENQLFPNSLKHGINFSSRLPDQLTPNGGWGDPRDQNLCLNMTLREFS